MPIYQQQTQILTPDLDAFGEWRADCIFRSVQELANAHSARMGIDRSHIIQDNLIWMLVRSQAVFHAFPGLGDIVNCQTWYADPGKITYPRYVSFTNEQGRQLAFLATSWVVVDFEKRSILPPGKNGIVFPPSAQTEPLISEPERLKISKDGHYQSHSRRVCYSDLDINGHMNNASYISWLMDLFPLAWHKRYRLASLHIDYLAEAVGDQQLSFHLYEQGLSWQIRGLNSADARPIFNASLSFAAK
jgi:medium-chain acyl-[acyl-carrier-protein] hydrolase